MVTFDKGNNTFSITIREGEGDYLGILRGLVGVMRRSEAIEKDERLYYTCLLIDEMLPQEGQEFAPTEGSDRAE